MKIRLDQVEIIGWYDGVLDALVSAEERTYLVLIASYDIYKWHLIHAVLELDQKNADHFSSVLNGPGSLEEQWNGFKGACTDFIDNYTGPAYITEGKIGAGEIVELIPLNSSSVGRLRVRNDELPGDPAEVEFWTNELRSTHGT